jgi:hypothetical protein
MLKSIIFLVAFTFSSYAHAGVLGDIDGDGQVGLPEAVYALQSLSGIRSSLPNSDGLKNIITVAKANGNFTDPVAAVNSITDASATNPYLVVIGPGVYTITQTLQMKEYVDIVGSGENVTRLTGAISTGSLVSSAIISGVSKSTLSSLTVENTGGGDCSVALFNSNASPTITSVTALASGGSAWNHGLYNHLSSPTITDVTVAASGGGENRTLYNSYSSPTMTNVTITASGATNNTGVVNNVSSPIMTDVTVTASGGTNSCGVLNDYSSPTMTGVTLTASGATNTYGSLNIHQSYPIIRRSTLTGGSYCLIMQNEATAKISQSTLIGNVLFAVAELTKCVACDDGSGKALDGNCQPIP